MGTNETTNSRPLRVAIAAGGTGGHIMPALALAEALANIGPDTEIDFLCGNRPVERAIYAQAEVVPRVFPVGSMANANLASRCFQWVGLAYSFLRSVFALRRYDVVVGMGGYVTGPVLAAARLLRKPIVLHEANTVLGRVNRIMARHARFLACGMPLVEIPDKVAPERIAEVGIPVRLNITRGDREEAARSMYMRSDAFTILVTGGSQGARGMNDLVVRALGVLTARYWSPDLPLQIVWSTGENNVEAVRHALGEERLRGQVWLAPTIDRMEQAYALADLVITRAGASTLAEVLLCGLPAIIFPLPHAADDHQRYNAAVLGKKNAAVVLEQGDTTPEQLARTILDLSTDGSRRETIREAALRLACPDAARDLATLIVEAAGRSQ
jgi:UDP-N-acetylglucosamine--N-acetylmuramyl-(pentapeptide) pyrophosphoryl-undecaprenol N-acetylglucosamine transferase